MNENILKRMRQMMFFLGSWLCLVLGLSACATASFSPSRGVGRVKQYDFYSYDVPEAFDGFRVAFASDFHYESKFNRKRLQPLVHTLQGLQADVLLLGGDYGSPKGKAADMDTLFAALARVQTPYGILAVMGNHEYGSNYPVVVEAMQRYGIRRMEHQSYALQKGGQQLVVCGVRNPFDLRANGDSPSEHFPASDFVILVTHAPDYAEDTDVSNVNLVLAGHTHGGQVSLFKRWAPVRHSAYGHRFLTGWKENSRGTPVVITNGIGTSRAKVRLFTPSEVVLIVLHRVEK